MTSRIYNSAFIHFFHGEIEQFFRHGVRISCLFLIGKNLLLLSFRVLGPLSPCSETWKDLVIQDNMFLKVGQWIFFRTWFYPHNIKRPECVFPSGRFTYYTTATVLFQGSDLTNISDVEKLSKQIYQSVLLKDNTYRHTFLSF